MADAWDMTAVTVAPTAAATSADLETAAQPFGWPALRQASFTSGHPFRPGR
jgi:hypothetical protein